MSGRSGPCSGSNLYPLRCLSAEVETHLFGFYFVAWGRSAIHRNNHMAPFFLTLTEMRNVANNRKPKWEGVCVQCGHRFRSINDYKPEQHHGNMILLCSRCPKKDGRIVLEYVGEDKESEAVFWMYQETPITSEEGCEAMRIYQLEGRCCGCGEKSRAESRKPARDASGKEMGECEHCGKKMAYEHVGSRIQNDETGDQPDGKEETAAPPEEEYSIGKPGEGVPLQAGEPDPVPQEQPGEEPVTTDIVLTLRKGQEVSIVLWHPNEKGGYNESVDFVAKSDPETGRLILVTSRHSVETQIYPVLNETACLQRIHASIEAANGNFKDLRDRLLKPPI